MLEKRLASRSQAAASTLSALSPPAAEAAVRAAEAADAAERTALERDLAADMARFEVDAEAYENSIQELLTSSTAAAGSSSRELSGSIGSVGGESDPAQAKQEELRRVHEREIVALELQTEGKRRGAAARLAQKRVAMRMANAETMRASGMDEQEVAKKLVKVRIFILSNDKYSNPHRLL